MNAVAVDFSFDLPCVGVEYETTAKLIRSVSTAFSAEYHDIIILEGDHKSFGSICVLEVWDGECFPLTPFLVSLLVFSGLKFKHLECIITTVLTRYKRAGEDECCIFCSAASMHESCMFHAGLTGLVDPLTFLDI